MRCMQTVCKLHVAAPPRALVASARRSLVHLLLVILLLGILLGRHSLPLMATSAGRPCWQLGVGAGSHACRVPAPRRGQIGGLLARLCRSMMCNQTNCSFSVRCVAGAPRCASQAGSRVRLGIVLGFWRRLCIPTTIPSGRELAAARSIADDAHRAPRSAPRRAGQRRHRATARKPFVPAPHCDHSPLLPIQGITSPPLTNSGAAVRPYWLAAAATAT